MTTKNITVSVDAETHRLARIRAAELDTSVSALVREYLVSLARPAKAQAGASEAKRRARGIREFAEQLNAKGGGLRTADNLSREELYDRSRAKAEKRTAVAARNVKLEDG